MSMGGWQRGSGGEEDIKFGVRMMISSESEKSKDTMQKRERTVRDEESLVVLQVESVKKNI
jgi:hypothetical protein